MEPSLTKSTLYYHCKRCLSYMPTSSNWNHHMGRCSPQPHVGNASTLGNGRGRSLSPVHPGFRLTVFTPPKVILRRIPPHANISEILENESVEKVVTICNRVHDGDGELSLAHEAIKRQRRTKTERPSEKPAKKTRKYTKRNMNKLPKRKPRSTKEGKPEVRKYHFHCQLCPGKFYIKRDLDVHLNHVHNGKRKLMECCVCGRVFNKRDSLNTHIVAHEAAEAREEKYNLLEPWTEEVIYSLRNYKTLTSCKFCLLLHSSYYSYVTHIHLEHPKPPEGYRIPCRFENCKERLKSIRELVDHVKSTHPQYIYGRLTFRRLNSGIFTGKRKTPDQSGRTSHNRTLPAVEPNKVNRKRNQIHQRTGTNKLVKSFIPFQRPFPNARKASSYEDEAGSDWEHEHKNSIRHFSRNDRMPHHHKQSVHVKVEADCETPLARVKGESEIFNCFQLECEAVKTETDYGSYDNFRPPPEIVYEVKEEITD